MQAQTLKRQFESLDLNKLPKEVIEEAMEIRDNTDNFSDQDLVDVFLENWTLLYDDVIKGQYPSAIPDEASQAPAAPKKPKTTPKIPNFKDLTEARFIQLGVAGFGHKKMYDPKAWRLIEKIMQQAIDLGYVEKYDFGPGKGKYTLSDAAEFKDLSFKEIMQHTWDEEHIENITKKFEPGDEYGPDFDYTGMVDYYNKVNSKTTLSALEDLKDSLVSVNEHAPEFDDEIDKIQNLIDKKTPTKKKAAPKKAPAAKKKAPAKKKRTTKTPAIRKKELMRYFDEELRIIKRFYNMLNKEVPRKRWISLHRFVQKALVDKRAHPNSKLADLVKTVAQKAENVTDQATQDMVKVTLDDEKLTARIAELAKQTAVYPSVRLFKRYIQLSGERAPDENIDRLIQAIEKAIATKKVYKKDPFGKELEDVLKMLKKARDNGRVEAMNVGLGAPSSGLAGAMDYALGKK